MHVTLPINFGNRQCDRLLIKRLTADGSLDRSSVLWMAFLVWQDFATARDDRRDVPLDPSDLAQSDAVGILEEFIGWKKQEGEFIASAIDTGFFTLTPISETCAQLVLTDFFPANANATRMGNSELGGIGRVYKNLTSRAEVAAADQLRLFEASGGLEIDGLTERDKKSSVRLIHAICMALHRPAPSDETWRTHLVQKAAEVIKATTETERECVLKWFVKFRSSQRIANRLDLIIDQFTSFVKEATDLFAK